MSAKKIKILAVNPSIAVYKHHIDYPYFLNMNLFHSVSFLKHSFEDSLEIDVFDAFACENSRVFLGADDDYIFGNDFEREKYSQAYDYILINFSPFTLYRQKNIDTINTITQQFPSAKIVILNTYTGGFCYMEYEEQHLKDAGLLFDALVQGNVGKLSIPLAFPLNGGGWGGTSQGEFGGEEDSPLIPLHRGGDGKGFFQSLAPHINLSHYITFLQKVSQTHLTDFYDMQVPSLPIYTSRGCIFNCSFCTSTNPNVKGFERYNIDAIREDIIFLKSQFGLKKVIILDALFNQNLSDTKAFLDMFCSLEIDIEIPNGVRLDLLDEEAIIKLSKLMKTLSVSIESGDKYVNDVIIGKKLNFDKINQTAFLCKKHGLDLVAHYIIGFPQESKEQMNHTLEFAAKLYEDYGVYPLLQFATPVPGTRLGNQANTDLYALNLFEKFQVEPLFDYEHFTKEDLLVLQKNFYKKIEVSKTKKIIINLTYACENNCVFCATGDRFKFSQDFGYVLKNLILYRKKGVELLDLDGGEPTLYKHLHKVLYYAKKLGYRAINITSSGRRYKNKELLEGIVQAGPTSLLVSLHGALPEIHDAVTRKNGSFTDTCLGLDNIVSLRQSYRFDFGINLTLCTLNEDNLREYLHFIKKWNPDVLNVQFMTPFGNAYDETKYVENTAKCCEVLKQEIKNLPYRVQLINLPFCYMQGFEEFVIGDVNKMERDMIFVGEKPSNLSDYLGARRYYKEACKSCTYKVICKGFYGF